MLIPRDESCTTNIYTSASLSRAEHSKRKQQLQWLQAIYFSIPVFTFKTHRTEQNVIMWERIQETSTLFPVWIVTHGFPWFKWMLNYSFYSLSFTGTHLIAYCLLLLILWFFERSDPWSNAITRIINLIILFQSKARIVAGYFYLSPFYSCHLFLHHRKTTVWQLTQSYGKKNNSMQEWTTSYPEKWTPPSSNRNSVNTDKNVMFMHNYKCANLVLH